MSLLAHALAFVALAAGLHVQANEFDPLMDATRKSWPEKRHIGVVCNYSASKARIEQLALAAGADCRITVVDVRNDDQIRHATEILAHRSPDFAVLLCNDPMVRDSGMGGTQATWILGKHGVPCVGITSKALGRGAAFAIGQETGFAIQVNPNHVTRASLTLPDPATFLKSAFTSAESPRKDRGMAQIALAD